MLDPLQGRSYDIHFIHEKRFFELTYMATLYPTRVVNHEKRGGERSKSEVYLCEKKEKM